MRLALGLLLAFLALPLAAQTDSCDIANLPAATLLVPYFEIEVDQPRERALTTIFSIVNTSPEPQIAHLVFWTDWGFPALDYNVYLTGYDVHSVDLYDVFVNGILQPDGSAHVTTLPGALSAAANPKHSANARSDCANGTLPAHIPASIHADVLNAFTTGQHPACGTSRIGGLHTNVIGSVTIDVVSTCTYLLPTDRAAYNILLYDNVLIGDYSYVDPAPDAGNLAQSQPMVHIRATENPLPKTFYGRFSGGRDKRQPLPSKFAARFVQGTGAQYETNVVIWREGVSGAEADCTAYVANARLPVKDIVRFDERENPMTFGQCVIFPHCTSGLTPTATSRPSHGPTFPHHFSTDAGGWLQIDLGPTQSWVVVSMFAGGRGRFAGSFDAPSLRNGCVE